MLFDKVPPEQAGVSSRRITEYLQSLENHGVTMHSLLLMKGEQLYGEYYWKPFDVDFCHRMYSQTKSYVSIAIGLLEEEGKLSLDAPIASFFPEKLDGTAKPYLAMQTVRDMLMMETCGGPANWFTSSDPDRTHLYLNGASASRPPRTIWEYDSAGSQVLCALVEKLSGMPMFDYLKSKIFDKLGTFRTATILKTKTDDSWGDSALVCRSRDMASFARFVMNRGTWNGERLMNEAYLRTATAALVDNNETGFDSCFAHGYGYQIWRTEQNGFAFVGMGDQLTICLPERDLIFVCTADDQGYPAARQLIVNGYFDWIVNAMQEDPLPADPDGIRALEALASGFKLRAASGTMDSPLRPSLDGAEFVSEKPDAPFTHVSFRFTENGGELRYTNAQGEKRLPFGMCENVFGKFPQYGYSDDHGGLVTTNGFLYDCAVSAAWRDDAKLMLRVQIIDRYFGNATFLFAFRDDVCVVTLTKTAENFLNEYQGRFLMRRI